MVKIRYAYKKKKFLNIRFNYRISIRLCNYFLKVYSHWAFWTVPAVCLAGPGLVGRGEPERGSVGLGCGTHVVWALTAPEHGTSDTCSLIAWTIDLLSNILWEGRVLPRPKQLKIINHKVNKTMHSTVLSERLLCCLHYRKRPVSHLWSRDYELAAFKWFVICWKNKIPLVNDHKHLLPICKRFVLFFVLNVKNDRLDATDFFFLAEYRCNFHFNFTQYNMILL